MDSSDREMQIRKMARQEAYEHRRIERFKLISSKRPILEDKDHLSSEVHISQVEALAEQIKKEGSVNNLRKLKNTFLQGDDYIGTFLRVNGALANLVSLLLSKDAGVGVEACKCLTNMAMGNHKTSQAIIKTAAPYLITFLHGGNVILQNHSAWTLGNLASDCQACRERLKTQGLLQGLLNLLKSQHPYSLESCTFALSAYTKYESGSNRFLCEEGILETLSLVLDDAEISETTQFNLHCILFHLTSPIAEVEDHFEASSIIQKIVMKWVNLCSITPLNILLVTPLLRCMGNLCSGRSSCVTKLCSQASFVDTCIWLLNSPYLYLRKETVWLLTNLAAANAPKVEDLEKILNHMERFLSENLHDTVSTEAARFILTAKRRFEELGLCGVSPELLGQVQNMQLSNRTYKVNS